MYKAKTYDCYFRSIDEHKLFSCMLIAVKAEYAIAYIKKNYQDVNEWTIVYKERDMGSELQEETGVVSVAEEEYQVDINKIGLRDIYNSIPD